MIAMVMMMTTTMMMMMLVVAGMMEGKIGAFVDEQKESET